VVAGDLVEVVVQGEQDTSTFLFSTGSVRRVRLFFDVVNASGQGKTLAD
jgi:methionine salvage enolase-phosphatase E1